MDSVAAALGLPPTVAEPAREERQVFTRPQIDWSMFRGFEELPGWGYERGVTGFSHLGLDAQYNELSPYVKATREMDNGLLAGMGLTYNSEGNPSVFVGVGDEYGPAWWDAGVATGYEATPLMPFARAGIGPVYAMPAYDGESLGAVIGAKLLELEW
jgi:choline dehydrogenase-like flavoprotein